MVNGFTTKIWQNYVKILDVVTTFTKFRIKVR